MKDPRVDGVLLVVKNPQLRFLMERVKKLEEKVNELERKANEKVIEAEFEKVFTPEKIKELTKGILPSEERLKEIVSTELDRILASRKPTPVSRF